MVSSIPAAKSYMSALVFVDTNVFVYARDARETSKREMATQWIARLWQEQTGRTSAQVLSEYYVTFTRKLKPGISARVWYSQFHNARKRYM